MRPSTQRIQGSEHIDSYGARTFLYRGIIRDDRGAVVWTCQHSHEFRDSHVRNWIMVHGTHGAALTCADDELARRETSVA